MGRLEGYDRIGKVLCCKRKGMNERRFRREREKERDRRLIGRINQEKNGRIVEGN